MFRNGNLIALVLFLLTNTTVLAAPSVTFPLADGSSSISIYEDTANGATISYVQLQNPTWTYAILSPNDATFDIANGEITTKKILDYESGPASHSYELHIKVTDTTGGRQDVVLTVHLLNVFDVMPTLTATPTTVTIEEEASIGQSLPVAVSVDDVETKYGDPDTMTYSLAGPQSTYFKIDASTGRIFVNARIDYEAGITSLTFDVTVTDKGGNSGSPEKIDVTVTNINDNAPNCSPSTIHAAIKETEPANTQVATLVCVDNDNPTASLTYTLINEHITFQMVSTTSSVIVTKAALDYDLRSEYVLIVHAVDTIGSISKTGTVTVSVQVLDVNMKAPTWPVNPVSVEVDENPAIGRTLYTCVAVDADANPGDITTYSITSVTDDIGTVVNGYFTIKTMTGALSPLVTLDYDTGSKTYTIIVHATDGGSPALPAAPDLTLTLNIQDVNDNTPSFTQVVYTLNSVDENTASVAVGNVIATDADRSAPNNEVLYMMGTMVTGDISHFGIDSSTGSVSSTVSLDRENIPRYIFTVLAVDKGSSQLTGTATVTVNVNDVNDLPPEFDQQVYSASVLEGPNGVTQSILTMTLSDGDTSFSGTNRVIIDTSSPDGVKANALFRIVSTANTFTITVKSEIDRETDPSIVFRVLAYDTGGLLQTSTATVTVTVVDVNEPPVWITANPKSISVAEDLSVGAAIITVQASDRDLGMAGELNYLIVNPSPAFAINAASGEVTSLIPFDFETNSNSYLINISASDKASPPLTSTLLDLTVTIKDVNDNTPYFPKNSYSLTVTENKPTETILNGIVDAANDKDSAPNSIINYKLGTLIMGDSQPFTTKTDSPWFSTTRELDREVCELYVFTLLAVDTGNPSLTGSTTVTVTLTDVNDNAPQFNPYIYTGLVREDASVGTSIVTVNATDIDSAANANIVLAVIGNGQGAGTRFGIDSNTGVVYLKRSNLLDRETVSLYTFNISASDGTHTTLATVTVVVTDANDNNPVMDPLFYNTEVDYNGVCGSDVTTILAYDEDTGNNSGIFYSFITSTFSFLFDVNNDTGVVRLQSRAAKNFRYVLEATATDGGTPALASQTPATLRVDTFDLLDVGVTFTLGIDRTAFEANRATFISEVQNFLRISYNLIVVNIACVETRDGVAIIPTTSRRRLLQTTSPVDVHVYVVDGNSTDDIAKINDTKVFVTSSQLTSVLAPDPRGVPVADLTAGKLEYFHVQKVMPFYMHVTQWEQTEVGILIITFSVLLALALITSCITVGCYTYRRRKKFISPVRSQITDRVKRPIITTVPDIDAIKKNPPPALMALPLPSYSTKPLPMKPGEDGVASLRVDSWPRIAVKDFDRNGGYLIKNRHFDGTAVDDATGKVYKYNTKTNEREWLTTPDGKAVTVVHH